MELPAEFVATFCTKIDYGCDQDRRYGRRLASVMPDPRENGFWRETFREHHAAGDDTPAFAFVTLERANAA